MYKYGKVYLVGSGPGDERLITMGAVEFLKKADVVIYDNLINESVLSKYCDESCERIYVGKSGAHHTLEQDGINELIAEKARTHRCVVRLKGGDPFIFGRGGEEALYLEERGIRYEIINGISSAYAVPSYAGIPITHRGYSSSVAFITGHEDPTKEKSDLQWDKLATAVQTLVFLMGVKNIPHIMKLLSDNGRNPETPVAVIQQGTYPEQKTVTGTVATIAAVVAREKITPPSIVVVGDVVRLREKLNWFESRPLFGKTIVVTRSRDQASDLVAKLGELGARVIEVPSIKIVPADDEGPLKQSILNIKKYDWILFTSVNGVDYFFRQLRALGNDSRALSGSRICAIGPATGRALESRGINPDFIPVKFISTEIVKEMGSKGEISGKSFLLPRADIAPDTLASDLLKAGAAVVDDVTAYRTIHVDYGAANNPLASESSATIDLVTFTSSSTARNFSGILAATGMKSLKSIESAAIGPVTAETAEKEEFRVVTVAKEHTIDGLVQAILEHFEADKKS